MCTFKKMFTKALRAGISGSQAEPQLSKNRMQERDKSYLRTKGTKKTNSFLTFSNAL